MLQLMSTKKQSFWSNHLLIFPAMFIATAFCFGFVLISPTAGRLSQPAVSKQSKPANGHAAPRPLPQTTLPVISPLPSAPGVPADTSKTGTASSQALSPTSPSAGSAAANTAPGQSLQSAIPNSAALQDNLLVQVRQSAEKLLDGVLPL